MADEILGDDSATTPGDVLKNLAGSVASKVEVETSLASGNVIPFDKKTEKPSLVGKILRPKITVVNSMGQEVVKVAPYGEPSEIGGIVKAGAVVVTLGFLGLVFGAGRLSK